jgi:2-polyprenyl-3-methyl-5-hydroxy-6-metoxy-1,4-benzoquinol methylase
MNRTLEPEILDSLSPEDPAARRSRRDLRIINWVMGNRRWFRRGLRGAVGAGERILELGPGTGEMGLGLAAAGYSVDGLDICPRPAQWPPSSEWHQADLRFFGGYGRYPVVMANLILHHFSSAELAELGARIAGARLIIASEPARRARSQALCAALAPLFGAHPVTRHDARISIAAGFLGDELPRALGLRPEHWRLRCHTTLLGAYRMVALRR